MLKLTYWNSPGRGWIIRTCFKIGGIPFDDHFVTYPELVAKRGPDGYNDVVPLGSIPTLELPDGKIVCQSTAIARYAAKLAKLYPSDDVEALVVDEIIESVNECANKLPNGVDEASKKTLREEYAKTTLVKFFAYFAKKITSGHSLYLVGTTMTLADLALYKLIKAFRSGSYDHIPVSVDAAFPALDQFVQHLEANPVFAPYKL